MSGIYCDKPCPAGRYGADCREECECGAGECHHVHGDCVCPAGYRCGNS